MLAGDIFEDRELENGSVFSDAVKHSLRMLMIAFLVCLENFLSFKTLNCQRSNFN